MRYSAADDLTGTGAQVVPSETKLLGTSKFTAGRVGLKVAVAVTISVAVLDLQYKGLRVNGFSISGFKA